jgi:type II secretory pathway pseudopilin PulG
MLNNKAKLPVLLLIVLLLISLVSAGGAFYLLQKEHGKNLSLQEELERVKAEQRATELRLKDKEQLAVSLEAKLKDANDRSEVLNSALQQEKLAKADALAKADQLKAEVDQGRGIRQDLENKLKQAQNDMQKLQAQLKELESNKVALEDKMKGLEAAPQGVELGKIVVSPEPAKPAPVKAETAKPEPAKTVTAKPQPVKPEPAKAEPAKTQSAKPAAQKPQETKASPQLEGKVLVINKDFNFAVINLGTKDGIEVGNLFSVYHGKKYLGDIKVEKVHESMSAAGFVAVALKDKVSEGDKVVLKAK